MEAQNCNQLIMNIYKQYQAVAESVDLLKQAGYTLNDPVYTVLYLEKLRLSKLIDEL